MTTVDHTMELPNAIYNPDRSFDGTRFRHDKQQDATWLPWRLPGFVVRDTGIEEATSGIAGVQVAKPSNPRDKDLSVSFCHDTDIFFTFVMEGSMCLEAEGEAAHPVHAGDAFTVPPDLRVTYKQISDDLELLEVALPGKFNTKSIA